MVKMKIKPFQLFVLIFLFEIGSAMVIGIGMQAKQNAWLAILLGMIGGLAIYLVYYFLYLHFPTLPLTSYLPKIIGKILGYPLSVVYILYFIYIASRVLRDFGDLLITSTLTETPLMVVNIMMIMIIIYANYLDIESLARTGEVFFIVVILFFLFMNLSVFSSELVKYKNLLPLLEEGWQPVITTAFPFTYTFPFGEMIVFTMILPFLNHSQRGLVIGLSAMVASGLLLSYTRAIDIAVLGTYRASTAMFPLLNTISKVNVGDFIQRLDAIVVSILVIGGFFKVAIFMYASVIGISSIFKVERKRHYIVLLVGSIILISSLLVASNLPEHIEIGLKIVPIYLHLPLQTGIPLILLVVVLIRKRLNQFNF